MFEEDTDVYRVFWGGGYFGCNFADGPKDYYFDWNITFFEDDGSGYHPGDVYAGPFTIPDAEIGKSQAVVNDSGVGNGLWGVGYWAWLPDPVTFNADTKYWIAIYGIDEMFPQSAWAYHNESLGGILLNEANFKSEYFGYPDWGIRRMVSILPSCLPGGKAGGLQILRCRGLEVKNYDFTLSRLDSEALRLLRRWGDPNRS